MQVLKSIYKRAAINACQILRIFWRYFQNVPHEQAFEGVILLIISLAQLQIMLVARLSQRTRAAVHCELPVV